MSASSPRPKDSETPKPVPCPECGAAGGYEPMGPYRVLCMCCGALLKNGEVGQ